MRRRDFVKGIVAVPVTAGTMFGQTAIAQVGEKISTPQSPSTTTAPPTVEAALATPEPHVNFDYRTQTFQGTVPDAVAATQGHFLDANQMATLRKLADVLLPPLNGYPGALQAGAPEFIDFLIGASPAEQQHLYQSGLDRLNKNAKKQFNVPFAEVNAEQADALLHPWLQVWMHNNPPKEPFSRFINIAHRDIRKATMNSQEWSIAATAAGERAPGIGLYWSPIDPDIQMYV